MLSFFNNRSFFFAVEIVALVCSTLLFAQGSYSPPKPSPSESFFKKSAKPSQQPSHPKIPISKPPHVKPIGPLFTIPGIVGMENGHWIGSDNLFNVGKHLEVVVEIVKPEHKDIPLGEELIKRKVHALFAEAGISTIAESAHGGPPLPMFHVLILVNTIEKGFVAYVAGRLFEAVQIKRVVIDPGVTFQAITWEKQDLLTMPADSFISQVELSVGEITKEFITRLKYFQTIQIQRK